MVVLSRQGSRCERTNILVHRIPNENRVIICLNTTLVLVQPTAFMFPVNGRVTRVWELSKQNVMRLDDHFQKIIDEESLLKQQQQQQQQQQPQQHQGAANALNDLAAFRGKNFQVDILPLDESFYSRIPEEYFEDKEKLVESTRSLWNLQQELQNEELYVVFVKAKQYTSRGNLCVEFDLSSSSGNLIIPGTLKEDFCGKRTGRTGKKLFLKEDVRVLLSDSLVGTLRGNVADQLLSYVKEQRNKDQPPILQLFSARGDQAQNCVLFEAIQKKDLFYLGEKRALMAHLCCSVCEVIQVIQQELSLGEDGQFNDGVIIGGGGGGGGGGGVLISFNNLQTDANLSLILS